MKKFRIIADFCRRTLGYDRGNVLESIPIAVFYGYWALKARSIYKMLSVDMGNK